MPGTKIKRGKDQWQLQVTCGTDLNGKPLRYTKTFHGTAREANAELSKFYSACSQGKVNRASSITISQVAHEYLKEGTAHLKKSSYARTESIIRVWIVPNIGKKKLNNFKRSDVQKFINSIDKSPKTVRCIYSVLSAVCRYALDMQYIEDTPCKMIRFPKLNKKESLYYTDDEIKQILSHTEDLRLKAIIYLAFFGGLRSSEICGLEWDCVHFDSNRIEIKQILMESKGEGQYIDTPKTESSRRSIAMPQEVMDTLQKLFDEQLHTEYPHICNSVIRRDIGSPATGNYLRNILKIHLKTIGIEYKGIHAFRHSHTSVLSSLDGIELKQISERLGHSQLSTTLNIYTHLFKNKDDIIVDKLSDYLKN